MLEDKPLDGNLRICPKVDQEPKPASGDAKIIEKLRTMNFRCRGAGLQLDDDLAEAEKIWLIEMLERLALVFQRKLLLRHKLNHALFQGEFHAFLIDILVKGIAHFPVDIV